MKQVILTLCNRSCTKVFTLWHRIFWKETPIPEPKFESSGGKTTKTGGTSFGAGSFPPLRKKVSKPNS